MERQQFTQMSKQNSDRFKGASQGAQPLEERLRFVSKTDACYAADR